MQNAGLAALGLNWRYLAFEVRPDNLRAAIEGARAMHFIGLNLTVPHKQLAVEMVDVVDEPARMWGAVNTIVFEGREAGDAWRPLHEFPQSPTEVRAHGFNTDADAVVRALSEDLGVQATGARVLLLGAGGAGRTAALKLASAGVRELFLVNRTPKKAEALAAEIERRWGRVKVRIGYPIDSVDLVLNATSLGLGAEDAMPLEAGAFPLQRARAVYDMIYRPVETPLLRLAKAAGCRTANGLGMLLYQGAASLELWTGRPAPIETMRRALRETLYIT